MARAVRARDLFDICFVSDPQMAPDGDKVAAVVTSVLRGSGDDPPQYRSRLHLFRVPRGRRARAASPDAWPAAAGKGEEFTSSEHRDFAPRFGPDGRRLAFLSVRAKDEPPQLHTMAVGGGESRKLTDHAAGVQEFVVRPSNGELFYLSRGDAKDDRAKRGKPLRVKRLRYRGDGEGFFPEGPPAVYACTPNGRPRRVKGLPERAYGLAFSPGGEALYFVMAATEADESEFKADIVALDVVSGELTVIAGGLRGPSGISPSPDGRRLAVTASHTDAVTSHDGVYVIDLDTATTAAGPPTLVSGSVDVSPAEAGDSRFGAYRNIPAWTEHDGEPALLVNAHVGGATGVGLLSLDGDYRRLQETTYARAVTAFSAHRSGAIAFVAETPVHPGELWIRGPDGAETRLSSLNDRWRSRLELASPEGPFEANEHGVRLWVMRPSEPRPDAAAVLQVHGGPHTAYGGGFLFEFQLLAARGYSVVFGNPRGSSGLGHAFAAHVMGDYGGDDARDVLDIADAGLRALGAEDAPLHLTGGSYGGFMTNWLVATTDRFRSAVSQRSISNWTSMYGTSDIGPRFVEEEIGGSPWADLDVLWRQSPLRLASEVVTPLLLIHSEEDWRCPIEQAEQFFSALKRSGRAEVELLRFPGEGHELSRSGRPDRRIARLEAIVGWFEAHE